MPEVNPKTYSGRSYYSTFPALSSAKMIVNLHGGGGNGLAFATQMQYGTLVGSQAVLVFPTATNNAYGVKTWNSGGAQSFNTAPDVAYLRDLIAHVKADALSRGITVTEVILVGHSNGGMMSYRLAIEYPLEFAGVFAMAADVMVDNPDTFTGKIAHYHGENDENVPLEGGIGINGIYYTPVQSTVEAFENADVDFNVLLGAAHTMSSLASALPSPTTFAQLINDFIQ